MRITFEANPPDYARYRFPYQIWAERETGEAVEALWERGFLPFSADPAALSQRYYLARSLRYDLRDFTLRKSRRYDYRQIDASSPIWRVLSLDQAAEQLPSDWKDHAEAWMQFRFGKPYLSRERLEWILASGTCTHLGIVQHQSALIAVILFSRSLTAIHYWFAFYHPEALGANAFGKWLIAKAAFEAQNEGLKHLYVGTAYGAKASYKHQGIDGAEFFDGNRWCRDIAQLKALQAADPV